MSDSLRHSGDSAALSIGSKRKLKLSPSSFDFVALAGRGAFGQVWVVRMKNDYSGRVMAMKIINKRDVIEREYVAHTISEKEIMCHIRAHPFIVDLYYTFQSSTSVYIVMEYLPGGNLLNYLQDTTEPWKEEVCRFYCAETLLALEYMHKRNIVYRDLKLENILLDMDGHIRLSDFGLSAQLKNSSERLNSMSGTAAYIAPEILLETGHGKSVDIWAFGILLFTMLVRESPFYSENLSELFYMIIHEPVQWDWYKNELSKDAVSLLKGLLTKEPNDRLGCGKNGLQDIKDHPFFSSIHFDEIMTMEPQSFIRPKLRITEHCSMQQKLEAQNPVAMTGYAGDDNEFAGFSFVASDIPNQLETDRTEDSRTYDDITLYSDTEDEELYHWPFLQGSLHGHIIAQIINYLTVEDIVVATGVSKGWNVFIWKSLHRLDLSTIPADRFKSYWKSSLSKLLLRPHRLTYLRLNSALLDDGVKYLPSLMSVDCLDMRGCTHLSSKALKKLLDGKGGGEDPKFPFIQILNLSDCTNITDEALEHLLPYHNLTQLYLANSGITGSEFAHIAKLPQLWRLDLQGLTKLRDPSLEHIVELPNLRVLELAGCTQITGNCVESLQTRLKQLEVLTWNEREPNEGENTKAKKRRRKLGLTRNLKRHGDKMKKERTSSTFLFSKRKPKKRRSLSIDSNDVKNEILSTDRLRVPTLSLGDQEEQKQQSDGKHKLISPRSLLFKKKKKEKTKTEETPADLHELQVKRENIATHVQQTRIDGFQTRLRASKEKRLDRRANRSKSQVISQKDRDVIEEWRKEEARDHLESLSRVDVPSLLADLGRKAHDISEVNFATSAFDRAKRLRSTLPSKLSQDPPPSLPPLDIPSITVCVPIEDPVDEDVLPPDIVRKRELEFDATRSKSDNDLTKMETSPPPLPSTSSDIVARKVALKKKSSSAASLANSNCPSVKDLLSAFENQIPKVNNFPVKVKKEEKKESSGTNASSVKENKIDVLPSSSIDVISPMARTKSFTVVSAQKVEKQEKFASVRHRKAMFEPSPVEEPEKNRVSIVQSRKSIFEPAVVESIKKPPNRPASSLIQQRLANFEPTAN